MSDLLLKVITPSGSGGEIECDSVHMIMPDDSGGKGGGSIGIRKGYENALIALDKGNVDAFLKGEKVYSKQIEGGFAVVKDNVITVMTQISLKNDKTEQDAAQD